ncbi:hypothetical protein HDK90DRAFT_262050 [Phyllosticta capitalensis]|uniref:Uncharacterized protein n=1 Tax=Phyllosticta capitalensis TaxID=121624 RepID=A0ABR1YRT0_9PEZI
MDATGSASHVTLSMFYRHFCEQTCSVCQSGYGDLVNLLTWTRCCPACLQKRVPELRVATAASARRILGLSKGSIKTLPSLKSVPGVFSMDEKPRAARVQVVGAQSALSAFGDADPESAQTADMVSRPGLEFMACCALPNYDPLTKRIQNGVSCAGCQLVVEAGIDAQVVALRSSRHGLFDRRALDAL